VFLMRKSGKIGVFDGKMGVFDGEMGVLGVFLM
jgi:hypothetical protein